MSYLGGEEILKVAFWGSGGYGRDEESEGSSMVLLDWR